MHSGTGFTSGFALRELDREFWIGGKVEDKLLRPPDI